MTHIDGELGLPDGPDDSLARPEPELALGEPESLTDEEKREKAEREKDQEWLGQFPAHDHAAYLGSMSLLWARLPEPEKDKINREARLVFPEGSALQIARYRVGRAVASYTAKVMPEYGPGKPSAADGGVSDLPPAA